MVYGGLVRFHGGKFRSTDLLSFFPLEYSSYIEPFAGGSGLHWHLDTSIKRHLNDLDSVLIRLYKEARDNPQFSRKIMKLVRLADNATDLQREFFAARLKFKLEGCPYAYWYLNRNAYSCYANGNRRNGATMAWNLIRNGLDCFTVERVREIRRRLKGVKLTNYDYRKAIERSKADFMFLDPPYHCEGEIYGHEMSVGEHEQLAKFLSSLDRRWMMTIAYSELSARLYLRKSWCHCRRRTYKKSANRNIIGQTGQELLVTNYDD